ncbi:hypothetical protein PFISCL1PPCAC_1344, partial [Pristionchus fissidentatus]
TRLFSHSARIMASDSEVDDLAHAGREMTLRCSCDLCMEAYDNDTHIPRVLSCGHSICQQCLPQLLDETKKYKCITCAAATVVPDAVELPVNRSLIDIVDFVRNDKPKNVGYEDINFCSHACTAGILPLKDVAICTTAECAMIRKKICLSCAIRHHRKHDIVLLETVTTEIRDKCKEQVEKLQKDFVAQIDEICELSNSAALGIQKMRKRLVDQSKMADMINRSEELLNEKESADLLEICQTLLQPFSDALSRWNMPLKTINEEMKVFDVEADDDEISVSSEEEESSEEKEDIDVDEVLANTRRILDEYKRVMGELTGRSEN